jgi:glycine cleavage system H protein
VVESNKAVSEKPDLVNSDPYGQGWFYKIKLSDPSEVNKLLSAAEYNSQLGQ